MHGELCYIKDRKAGRKTHVALWGAEQIVEEDGTPPVHPVDALPDTDTSPGLFVTFILKQRACETHRGEATKHMDQLISQIVLADSTLVIKVVIQQKGSCVLQDISEDFGWLRSSMETHIFFKHTQNQWHLTS